MPQEIKPNNSFNINRSFKHNKFKCILFYDGNCLTCHWFLRHLAKFKLPTQLYFAPQQGKTYEQLKDQYEFLHHIDTIVIATYFDDKLQKIRTKADACTWLLANIRPYFKILRWGYLLLPFFANFVYELVAKNRKRTLDQCPLPPSRLRKHLIFE